MFCKAGQTALVVVLLSVPTFGQEWATKMFVTTSHDFGTVARAQREEFEFVLENLYVEDVHIASVRASCSCTTPEIKTGTLKTHQKGAILAKFNTAAFLGSRGATLTVTFDKPFFAEVQLHVRGFIRSDVLLQPGSVEFGSIDQDSVNERAFTVSHAGRENWRITAVRSTNSYLSATATEVERSAAQVTYQIVVRLDQRTPTGYLAENLTIETNDPQSPEIQVLVNGIVRDRVSASPTLLFLGVVEPGQKAIKQIVVRGEEPFHVKKASCDGPGFEIAMPDGAVEKSLHLVPVTFVAPQGSGRVETTIYIETSLGEVTPVRAYADVTGR
jgi:hypothetical protein